MELVWKATCLDNQPDPTTPKHLYGEGDMKTRAWVMHLIEDYQYTHIVVISTDLDNIVSLEMWYGCCASSS